MPDYNAQTFTLNELLDALAATLQQPAYKKIAALFIGQGNDITMQHGFKPGGIVHYMIQQTDRAARGNHEQIVEGRTSLTQQRVMEIATDFFDDPTVRGQLGIHYGPNPQQQALHIMQQVTNEILAEPTFVLAKKEPTVREKMWQRFLDYRLRRILDKTRGDKILKLVLAGANPNIQSSRLGWTSLHVTAINNDLRTVRTLLNCGADPNLQDNRGWIPLHYAAQYSSPETLATLLKGGTDIDAQTKNSGAPQGNFAKKLWKGITVPFHERIMNDDTDLTAVHIAICRGSSEVLETLVDYGANLYLETRGGYDAATIVMRRQMKDLPAGEQRRMIQLLEAGFSRDAALASKSQSAIEPTREDDDESGGSLVVRRHHRAFPANDIILGGMPRGVKPYNNRPTAAQRLEL